MTIELKVDLHTHTLYSKEPRVLGITSRALYSPKVLIKTAIKRGLDCIAITDHDNIDGAFIGRDWLKEAKISDFNVIIGEEVTTSEGHMLAVNIYEEIKKGMTAQETLDEIKRQGGVAIAPHPFTPLGLGDKLNHLKMDGIEVFNPFAWIQLMNKKAEELCLVKKFAPMAGSDAHVLSAIGQVYTKIEARENKIQEVLKGIKEKRTVPFSKMSRAGAVKNLILNGVICLGSVRKDAV